MSYAAFPLIEISGTPFERGRAYGQAVAGRIRASIGIYAGQLAKLGLGRDEVREVVRRFVPVMADYAPDLVEEMRGIAAGATCAFEEIALVNARTEIIQIGQRMSAAKAGGAEPDGCTGVVVMPEASADGNLIHAQNWDWRPECVETAIVLRVRREDGPDLLTFTEAGGLARSGFNAAGLAITANYLESDLDYRQTGIPLPLIRRRYLESEHLAEGIKLVATTKKSAANNMMLSTAAGFAIDFECAPNEAFALYPVDGLLVHANHWTSVAALAKLKDTGIADVPDSFYRDYRVREALAKKTGRIALDDVKAALFDDFGTPYAVCAPPRPGPRDSNIAATVAMIVMLPQNGFMEIAPMPALNRQFTRYDLTMEKAARAVA
jgi:isopenicillin-N N-acyltransferase-like protein